MKTTITDWTRTLTMALGICCLVWTATASGQSRPKDPILLTDPELGTCGSWLEQAKLTASDADAPGRFGRWVSISGDTVVVGAYGNDNAGAGSAYVFHYDGATWAEQAKLSPSDGFGRPVAIDGDTIVVGESWNVRDSTPGSSAYVFHYDGATWAEQAKLIASDADAYDGFGRSVAISGDTVVVGAFGNDDAGSFSGSAYVFHRDGTGWIEQAKLTASDAEAGDLFGLSVAISGDTIVVGASGNSGSAYVFRYDGANWVEQAKLIAPDTPIAGQFGISVAFDGDRVVVGARGDGHAGRFSGSVYVFHHDGTDWIEQAKLTASDAAAWDAFGESVAIGNDVIIVGSRHDDGAGFYSGSAYVFRYDGTDWIEQQAKLTASDGVEYAHFGYSVAIDGGALAVGAPGADSAYVFEFVEHECPECLTDADCADGIDCTVNSCVSSACVNTPDDAFCDDGLFCNGAEICDSIIGCQPGINSCPDSICDENASQCVACLADSDCDDSLFCNGAEICDSIIGCQPGINPCPDSMCDENASQCVACLADSDCDDSLFCNGAEICDSIIGCQPGIDPCPDSMCNENASQCVECLADSDCDDGLFCNGAEICDSIIGCQPGINPCPDSICDENASQCVECLADSGCDDLNACTDDVCAEGFCEHVNNAAACNDGNLCTDDVCSGGLCVSIPNTAPCADDGNICTDDVCSAGVCTHPAGNEGGACDDGLACTDADTCSGGVCTGDPLDGPPVGGECDDNLCTERDLCVAGACEGGTLKECEFSEYGDCNSNTGECFFPPLVVRVLESGTGAETLNAFPGEIIELEVLVECHASPLGSGCELAYEAYQLDIAGNNNSDQGTTCGYDPLPGGTGRLDHCSSCDIDCMTVPAEVAPSPNVCMYRDDFLFERAMTTPGAFVVEPTNPGRCTIGAARFGGADFLLPDTMRYLLTFALEVSADASGTFEVGLEGWSLPCDQGADSTKFIDDFACESLIVVPAVVNVIDPDSAPIGSSNDLDSFVEVGSDDDVDTSNNADVDSVTVPVGQSDPAGAQRDGDGICGLGTCGAGGATLYLAFATLAAFRLRNPRRRPPGS